LKRSLTRYIRSFASLAAGATQGLQTPHIAIRCHQLKLKKPIIKIFRNFEIKNDS